MTAPAPEEIPTLPNADAAPEHLLTAKQVCRQLACVDKVLLRLCHLGELPFVKLKDQTLRFRQADVDHFVREKQAEPDPRSTTGTGAKYFSLPADRVTEPQAEPQETA